MKYVIKYKKIKLYKLYIIKAFLCFNSSIIDLLISVYTSNFINSLLIDISFTILLHRLKFSLSKQF